jgi:hypothetical protein
MRVELLQERIDELFNLLRTGTFAYAKSCSALQLDQAFTGNVDSGVASLAAVIWAECRNKGSLFERGPCTNRIPTLNALYPRGVNRLFDGQPG